MRKYLIGVSSAILIFVPVLLSAQGPGRGHAFHPRGCLALQDLRLSVEQNAAFRTIEERYSELITLRRKDLMIKRLELQNLIRDASVPEGAIRLKARELETVQEELRREMIDYQIEIRSILSPEQLQRWCTLMGGAGQWPGN